MRRRDGNVSKLSQNSNWTIQKLLGLNEATKLSERCASGTRHKEQE